MGKNAIRARDGLGRLRRGERLSVVQLHVPGYEHSRAFDEVSHSLVAGLRTAGFDADHVLGGPRPGRRNILLGAHLLTSAQLRRLPPNAIVYNHEQIDGSSMLSADRLRAFSHLNRWDYSARNVASWRRAGLDAAHVPIGWSPDLVRIHRTAPDIDVLFYGSFNDRRRAVLQALLDAGVRVEVGFGVYGTARDAMIARSRLVINIQFYEARILEMVRLSYLFANAVPVVSETSNDIDAPAGFDSAAAFAPYDHLVPTTLAVLADPRALHALGGEGRRAMESQPWNRSLEAVLPARHVATGA